MSTVLRRVSFCLLVALALAAPALAGRQGRLIGKVVDPAGQPVAGVAVTATSKDVPDFRVETTTDGKGLFKVDFEKVNVEYTYRLEKAGYVSTQVNQVWTVIGTDRITFTLQPGQSAAAADLRVPVTASQSAVTDFNAGVRAFEAKDWATAVARMREAVTHDPALVPAWSLLAQASLEQKNYGGAAEAAEKAVALGAAGEAILWTRWEAYRHLGDPAKTQAARDALEKAGQLKEEAKRIHNEGVSYAKLGLDADALAKFKEAVEIDPSLDESWLAMAVTALKMGQAEVANAAATRVLQAAPGNEQALRLRYNAALALGDEAKIADALFSLSAIEPAAARDNLFKLGVKAFDSDDTARAKVALGKVLELDPDHARAHYYLGVLYAREGAKAQARTHLRRFLALAPGDPDAATAKGLLEFVGN